MAKILFIVGEGFEDSEFIEPFDRLKQAGHEIDIMGSQPGEEVRGKRGQAVAHIGVAARCSYPDHYDALVIPGGHGPDRLRMDEDIVNFVRGFMDTDKPVAAICHGPQLLIEADAVRGRTLTSWPSVKTDLINAGANWVDEAVVFDGNLITSRKPGDLKLFNDAILQSLPPDEVDLDEEGFLQDPDTWNEQLALWLAKQEHLDAMNNDRWQVIYALRDYYHKHHHVPDFRHLCEAAHQEDVYCMERLFENDGSKAWRIAGLPNPGEEIKSYL